MENFGLYNKLITLPLFIGMSHEELERIIAQTKFDFQKFEAGSIIVKEGQKSGQLLLLVDGEVELSTSADDHGYTVYEEMRAPLALQPQHTLGLNQRYTCTAIALTACSLICINKTETLRLTSDSLIFRLNFLNILSTVLQKKIHQDWRSMPPNLEQRMLRFFLAHCQHPAGHKVFKINMERLAAEVNDSRLHISQLLNQFSSQGLLSLSRGKIVIPAIEKLSAELAKK